MPTLTEVVFTPVVTVNVGGTIDTPTIESVTVDWSDSCQTEEGGTGRMVAENVACAHIDNPDIRAAILSTLNPA